MGSVPLQRSKAWLEEKGWHVWITEHWNQWAHVRQDMYGLIDFVAIRHDSPGVWGVNACEDNGAVQGHCDKYLNGWDHPKKGRQPPNPHLACWLAGGNRFSIFGWGKRGAMGKRKTWTLRVVDAFLEGSEVKFREVANVEDPVSS